MKKKFLLIVLFSYSFILFSQTDSLVVKKEKRIKIPIKGIFGTIAKKAVTLLGAASYTSGNQKWKGATPILKNKPINIKIKP